MKHVRRICAALLAVVVLSFFACRRSFRPSMR